MLFCDLNTLRPVCKTVLKWLKRKCVSTYPGCPPLSPPLGKDVGGSHLSAYIEFMVLTIILPQDTEIYNSILLYTRSKNKCVPLVGSVKLQIQQLYIVFHVFCDDIVECRPVARQRPGNK